MGTVARDGECLTFDDPLIARLEADYWIKCIGLCVKHTLRMHSEQFFRHFSLKDLDSFWQQMDPVAEEMPVQILVACVHVLMCRAAKASRLLNQIGKKNHH